MSYRNQLIYMLKNNRDVMKKLIDDVTEEESLEQGSHGFNHIRWQVGHLLYAAGYSYSLLNQEYDDFTQYKDLFGGGAELSEDPSVYSNMADLRDKMYAVHNDVIAAMEKSSEDDLTVEIGEEGKKTTVWQTINFLCMHEFYHAGQIVNIRKILKRERPFG